MLESDILFQLWKYKKHSLWRHSQEIKVYKMLATRGLKPKKCLGCFSHGISYCRYWQQKNNCGQYEIREVDEKIEKLL